MAVFFAAVLFVFIGMTGLAVDYGFAALERRVLQNAVDAAAVTGATDLASGVSPEADVQTIASRNNIALSTTVVCEYVDNSNPPVVTGACSSTPSGTTSGVKVSATNNRATYFMRVFNIQSVTVSATSAARVHTVDSGSAFDQWGSVFIVCGWEATTAELKSNGKWQNNAQKTDLLKRPQTGPLTGVNNPSSWPTFLPAASSGEWPLSSTSGSNSVYNKWFVVHDENDVAKCGINDSGFKGLNSSSGTFAVPTSSGTPPIWSATTLTAETGSRSGPATAPVPTTGGCGAITGPDDPKLHDCIMFLPVFSGTLAPPDDKVAGDYRVRSVRWQPFMIKREIKNGPSGNTNTHYAAPCAPSTATSTDAPYCRGVNIVRTANTILAPWTKNSNAIVTAVQTIQ
jgi:Flp pilus assembly protein TadG